MPHAVIDRLLDDDVVQEHLTEAARHAKAAVVRLTGAEKPRETHRARTLVLALAMAAGAAVATKRHTAA
jgi:hypothetical protein